MSLKPIESFSLRTYFKTGVFTGGTLYRLAHTASEALGPPSHAIIYYDRLDAIIASADQMPSGNDYMVQFDPLGADNQAPLARAVAVVGPVTPTRLCVGEWDRANNTQQIYGGTGVEIWLFDPATLVLTDYGSSYWPFNWDSGAGGSGGAIGGWDDGGSGDTAVGDFHFFETWGYAVRACARVKHTDGNIYRGLALVSLADGKATLLDVPTRYVSSPRALFEAPVFNGDEFTLGDIQFVPDDDDVPDAPKGRFFLTSYENLGGGAGIPSYDHRYLKIIEWNPEDAPATPGNPNREHLREILMTQLHYVQKDEFESEGGVANSQGGYPTPGGTSTTQGCVILYHPPSRTLNLWTDWGTDDAASARGQTRHSLVPVLAQIEPVTAQSEVETNKTIVFKSRGLGDLGDPLAGITVSWTLERRSTIDEPLDTSGAPVSNVVAHPPIDPDTCVVKYLGTPLTEGVDYSLVEATGTITWMGAHSPPAASGYTASYRHSTVSATPPHGSLLQETSETDLDGVAQTRVQYPEDDDLESGRDYLTVEMSDD